MWIRVFYHDRCFDGAVSAAVFADFYQSYVKQNAEFAWAGLTHESDQQFDTSLFDGDENVIVDFKYCSSDKLTWWFDHHQSAFLSSEDEIHFRNDTAGRKFYGPDYRSCTKLIADVVGEQFGYDTAHLGELIHWADVIDGARYESAKDAVLMGEPAMKLTLVLEAASDNRTKDVIPLLRSESLGSIISRPEIQSCFEELYERHLESIKIIRECSMLDRAVLFFDLAGTELRGYNKFIPYYLFPESLYTVSVVDAGFRTKISVGSNPWATHPPKHNLATLCERFGGGGHPRVGAISLGPGEIERAREMARKIVAELGGATLAYDAG